MTGRKKARRTWIPPRIRSVAILYLLVIAANAFDAWATLRGIAHGGFELNPVMRAALAIGPWCFLAVKMTLIFLAAAPLAILARRYRAAWWTLIGAALLYTHLAIYHLALIVNGIGQH